MAGTGATEMVTVHIETADKPSDLDGALDVVRSYPLTQPELRDASYSLEQEFDQIGADRAMFIAWDGSAAAGIYQLIFNHADNDSDLADGQRIAHLHHLRVRHELRRRGLGRQLVSHAEGTCRSRGFQCLTLGVDSWNSPALDFYLALGYARFKQIPGRTAEEIVIYLRKKLVDAEA